MMVQAPDWATHHIKWNGMEAFYNDERFIGFNNGRKMWAGNWNDLEHKKEWTGFRVREDKARIIELFPIQENE